MAEVMEKAHSGGSNKHGYDLHLNKYKSDESCEGTFWREN